jgi:hypothetical protein
MGYIYFVSAEFTSHKRSKSQLKSSDFSLETSVCFNAIVFQKYHLENICNFRLSPRKHMAGCQIALKD